MPVHVCAALSVGLFSKPRHIKGDAQKKAAMIVTHAESCHKHACKCKPTPAAMWLLFPPSGKYTCSGVTSTEVKTLRGNHI